MLLVQIIFSWMSVEEQTWKIEIVFLDPEAVLLLSNKIKIMSISRPNVG